MNFKEQFIVDYIIENQPVLQAKMVDVILQETGEKIATRNLRKIVKSINEQYIKGDSNFIIASGGKGMYITKDRQEILKFNHHKKKLALSLLRSAYQTDKRINEKLNISFDDYVKGN